MKVLIVILVILAGICLGLYLGLWLCFIGGIVQFIEGVTATPVGGLDIAVGILRFLVSGIVGWGTFLVITSIGAFIALFE